MKITCPSCSTSYDVRAEALGKSGRSVKCTRCGTRWHAMAEDMDALAAGNEAGNPVKGAAKFDPMPENAAMPDPEDWGDEAGEADFDADDTEAGAKPAREIVDAAEMARNAPAQALIEGEVAETGKPKDIESQARRPRIRIRRARRNKNSPPLFAGLRAKAKRLKVHRLVGAMVFLLAVALGVFTYGLRNEIVSRVPDLAGLYRLAGLEVNLRGLEFRDLRTFREVEAGNAVLVIEGTIENPGKKASYVPAVRLALRSEDAQEIYAWIVEPKVRQLEAGGTTRFRTRLTTPPDLAADIHVRFTDRRNQQAKL